MGVSDWTYIITHVATGKVLATQVLPGMENVPWVDMTGLVVIKDRTNTQTASDEERWYITHQLAREVSSFNTERSFYQFTNVKSGMQYKVGQYDGSKLEPTIGGTTNLLHGWFNLVRQ